MANITEKEYVNQVATFFYICCPKTYTAMQTWEDNSVEILEVIDSDESLEDIRDLMVFNDDVNTFDFVIQTLIEVCNHTPEQAEQCTLIIHYRGKCSVKKGTFDELRPMRDAITERGIGAAIV